MGARHGSKDRSKLRRGSKFQRAASKVAVGVGAIQAMKNSKELASPSIQDVISQWLWTALDNLIAPSGVWSQSFTTSLAAGGASSSNESLEAVIAHWLWTALDDAIAPPREWAMSGVLASQAGLNGTPLVDADILAGALESFGTAAKPTASTAGGKLQSENSSSLPERFDLTADEGAAGTKVLEQYDLTADDNMADTNEDA